MNAFDALGRPWRGGLKRLRILADPAGHARSLGVRIGHKDKSYRMMTGTFGSEPWLSHSRDDVHSAVLQFRGPRRRSTDTSATPTRSRDRKTIPGWQLRLRFIELAGVSIGDNVSIGAGSIVARDIPTNSVAAGVPAGVVKALDDRFTQAKAQTLGSGALNAKDKEAAPKPHFGVG